MRDILRPPPSHIKILCSRPRAVTSHLHNGSGLVYLFTYVSVCGFTNKNTDEAEMMRSINIKRERKKHYVLMMMSRQKKTTTKNICIIIYLLKSVCIVWLLVKLLLLALLSWPLAVNSYLKMDFVYMQSTSKSELFPRTVGPSSTLLDYALVPYVTTAVRAVTSDLFLPSLQATCVECAFIVKHTIWRT